MNQQPTPAAGHEGSTTWFRSQWNSNHVNFLLVFVGVTILFNMIAVAYQQSKLLRPETRGSGDYDSVAAPDKEIPLTPETSVSIRVIGAPTLTGNIVVQISDSQTSMDSPELAWLTEVVPLDHGEATWLVDPETLPDMFGVTAFHDEDGDKRITVNSMGVPLERYGYSQGERFLEPDTRPTFDHIKVESPPLGGRIDLFIR